jgi:hypothetical protein
MVPAIQTPATGHETTERSAAAATVTGFDQTPAALATAVVGAVDVADEGELDVVDDDAWPVPLPPPHAARTTAARATPIAARHACGPRPPTLTRGRWDPNDRLRTNGDGTTYRAR